MLAMFCIFFNWIIYHSNRRIHYRSDAIDFGNYECDMGENIILTSIQFIECVAEILFAK